MNIAISPPVARLPQRFRAWLRARFALFIGGLVLVLAFVWSSHTVAAQGSTDTEGNFIPAPYISHLTNEEGLAQNRVTAITQDQRGFVWIGTSNGVSRFDGYTVTTLQHERDNPDSLGGNNVLSLLVDRNGGLWVGTVEGGLTHYDPLHHTFARYTHSSPNGGRDIGRLIVYTIYEDADGRIWFGGTSNSPLSYIDPATDQVTTLTFGREQPASPTGAVREMRADDGGLLWLVTDSALLSYDPAAAEPTTYPAPGGENQLSALSRDSAGNWWVVGGRGLYRFDATRSELVLQNDTIRGGRDILTAQDGHLWVSTTAAGLFEVAPLDGAVLRNFTAVPTDAHSLAENSLGSLYQDNEGLMWVATANSGVDRFDPEPSGFAFYRYDPAQPEGMGQGAVTDVVGQGENLLWMVTNGVLNEVSLDTNQVTLETSADAIPTVSVLYPDSRGALWIGLSDGNVLRRDADSSTPTPIMLPTPPPSGRAPAPIANLLQAVTAFQELGDGTILVGVARIGMYRVAPNADMGEYVLLENGVNAGGEAVPIPPNVGSFTSGPNSTVWVGHTGGILAQLIFTPLTFRIGMPLPDIGGIEQAYTTRNGQLWLATPRGLAQVGTDGIATRLFTTADGLPSNNIVSVVEDNIGRLWLGTQNGLASFDPATNAIQHYGVSEGVREREFLSNSVWRLDDGRLAFGGREGLTLFDPALVTLNSTATVTFTDLRLFNESVVPAPNALLTEPIWATDAVTFNANQDIISVEFAALGYRAPSETLYRYQLQGFHPDWNVVDSTRRFATYTNLPAGNYTLLVQTQAADGTWVEPGASLAISVLPAWWETMWFRGSVVVLAVGGVIGLWMWRSTRLRRRTVQLEREVAARTQDLSESEARFRGLSSSTFEAIIIHEAGLIQDVNRAALDLFGYPATALIGQPLRAVVALGSQAMVDTHIKHPATTPYEIEGVTAQGDTIPLEVRDGEIPFGGRTARVAALRDLTSRRSVEAHRERVAAMEERERIGRELHDDLGQVMGYVSVQAQAALTRLAQGDLEETGVILRQLTDAAHEAHDEVRQYITGIRTNVPATSFREAVERYAAQMESRYGLRVLVSYPQDAPDSPLAPEVETQALRILQEALTNVRKHSKTVLARLIFTLHADDVQFIVSDEGQGFTVETPVKSAAAPRNFGLSIMKERAEAVGGTLTVQSTQGAGTQIVVRLPRVLKSVAATSLGGLRVLVVDDHPLYIEGLRNLLAARGLRIVGVARDGIEAQERARALRPDLILMDVEMPNRDGLEATRLIKAEMPATKIVMLTVAADDSQLFQALQYGASGYLLKDLEGDRFFQMLGDVVRGETVLSPNLAAQVIHNFAAHDQDESLPEAFSDAGPVLTLRQQEVLDYIARGMSNKEIAAAMYISERTVKHHVGLILERLGMRSRYELARYAQEQGQDPSSSRGNSPK